MRECERETLIELIYEAAVDAPLWVAVLERLSDVVSGGPANLTRLNLSGTDGTGITARVEPSALQTYLEHFAAINPRFGPDWSRPSDRALPSVYVDEERIPREVLTRSEYFNDFERPMGWERAVVVGLGEADGYSFSIVLGRAERKGAYADEELVALRSLQPHLIRAYNVSARLAEQQGRADQVSQALERSSDALFVVDAAGRLDCTNAAAERLLTAGESLKAVGGRLSANLPQAARRLATLIGAAGSKDPGARTGGSMALDAPGRAGHLSLTAIPLQPTQSSLFAAAPSVLLVVKDSGEGVAPLAERLRALYGLTAAEARTAMAVAGGSSLREIAARHEVSVNTVRAQLAQAFSKTGTHRQSELAGLVLRSTNCTF